MTDSKEFNRFLEDCVTEGWATGGFFPLKLFRGGRSDVFYFKIDKDDGKIYQYGPFNREATKRYLRQLSARLLDGMSYIPAILDSTLKGRVSIIKVDASMLSSIWRDQPKHKRWAYSASRIYDTRYLFEELDTIMKESINDEIILEKIDSGDESEARDLIDLVVQGVSSDRILDSVVVSESSPWNLGQRVLVKESFQVLSEEEEVFLTVGDGGVVSDISEEVVEVSFDRGYLVGFSEENFANHLEVEPPNTVGFSNGDVVVRDDGPDFEVAAIDFLTNKVLAVDTKNPSETIFVDLKELNSKLASGKWKILEDNS